MPVSLAEWDPKTETTLSIYQDRRSAGCFRRSLSLYGLGYDAHLECPQPRDWSFPQAAPVVLLTPLTVVVDLVTVPVEVIWIFFTTGHGDPLMPWNDVEEGLVD